MKKKRILILGAGISGLTIAYYLAKYSQDFVIEVLEKNRRAGGWLSTDTSTPFFFEKGPRTFRCQNSSPIMDLIKDVGLQEEVIRSHRKGAARFVLRDGVLRKMSLWNFSLLKALICEPFVRSSSCDDETIWSFAKRRFNENVAKDFFDPLVVGIFGGDLKKLSLKSCFPKFKEWEERYGSVLKGYFKTGVSEKPFLFGLKKGVVSLVEALLKNTKAEFHFEVTIEKIEMGKKSVTAYTDKGVFEAEYLFCALPNKAAHHLMEGVIPSINAESLTVVNVAYQKKIPIPKGFGYLVSSFSKDSDDQKVLGVVFDSSVFPSQNKSEDETRLTVMLKGGHRTEEESSRIALESLKKDLQIEEEPDCILVSKAEGAFPQMELSHAQTIKEMEEKLRESFPHIRVVGNYLHGVSVNDCIAFSKQSVLSFLESFK